MVHLLYPIHRKVIFIPFRVQDVFKKHQDASKTLPRGFKTHLIWVQDGLRRSKTHLRHYKTSNIDQYRPILTKHVNPDPVFNTETKYVRNTAGFAINFRKHSKELYVPNAVLVHIAISEGIIFYEKTYSLVHVLGERLENWKLNPSL